MTDSSLGDLAPEDLTFIVNGSEEQLFAAAGRALLDGGAGFGSRDDGHNARFGRDWVEAKLEQLRPIVCSPGVVDEVGGDLTNDILTLLPMLAIHLGGDALLTAIVAGILLRRGITAFCAVN